jgi:hypothetical protein
MEVNIVVRSGRAANAKVRLPVPHPASSTRPRDGTQRIYGASDYAVTADGGDFIVHCGAAGRHEHREPCDVATAQRLRLLDQ